MKTLIQLICVGLAFSLVSGCAKNQTESIESEERSVKFPSLTITWQDTNKYRDINPANEHKARFRNRVFSQLEAHIVKLVDGLEDNVEMSMTFTNLDLAGDVKFMANGGQRMRVVESLYWPKMRFKVRVSKNGTVILDKDVELKDMMFMDRSLPRFQRNDFLRYEKRMLDDWFKNELHEQLSVSNK